MQTNAYLRSKGKSRLGKIPKPVQLSRSPEDEDYYGMPTANPFQPLADKTKETYNTIEPPVRSATTTMKNIITDAGEAIEDGMDTVSEALSWIDFMLPSRGDLADTTITRGYHHDHVTLLPAPKRDQSVNMFTAMQENPVQVIGQMHTEETPSFIDTAAISSYEYALTLAFSSEVPLSDQYDYQTMNQSEKLQAIKDGDYGADEEVFISGMTYTEIANILSNAKGGNLSESEKPIIGIFSQNTPTFLWPWTREDGGRYTAVDFADMEFFEGKIGRALKFPIEQVMEKKYDKVGTLPAYGAWGDIVLGIPTILLVVGGITFGGPAVIKAGKDAWGVAKTAATIPITWAKTIFVDMPLDIITSIQDKVRDFTKPRMVYKEGKYTPATIEAVIPPAHKIKMFLSQNKGKIAAGGAGFLGLAALSIVANRKFGVVQNTKNFVADQTYQAKNTQYIPTYHPEYNNWNANRQVRNRQNR